MRVTRVEGGTTYTQGWDAENRLATVTVNGQTTTFYYDGDGQRVKKVQNGQTTVYIGALYEKNVSTGVVTTYYFAGSTRIATRVGGVLYYLHGDHLGSTSLTTDNSGNRVGELKYYPFGETRYSWGSTPTDRRYTGQREESALGSLYDYGARMYSPAIGRFLSADTIVPGAGNPQAWNRYAYVVNSPLKYTDPSGHCFIILCIVAIGAAVVSVAAATEAVAYTAEVVQTGSGWDATDYWDRVTHPRPETVANAAVVVASTVAEPLDYLSTGVQCLTSGCSVADVALTVVPGAWGAVRKGLDKAVDAARALENAGDARGYIRAIPESQVGTSQGFKTFKGEDGLSVFEDVSPDEVLAELPGVREPNTTVTIPKTGLPTGTRVLPTDAPGLSKRLSDAHRILVRPEGWSVDRFAQALKKLAGWE